MTPDEAVRVLAVFEKADLYEGLTWRVKDGDVTLLANCSDVFAWATADCEEITAGDIPALERALADLLPLDGAIWLPELFAARKRRMRPQKPVYKDFEPGVAALFDACCTEEERAEFDRKDHDWWLAFAHSRKAATQSSSPSSSASTSGS